MLGARHSWHTSSSAVRVPWHPLGGCVRAHTWRACPSILAASGPSTATTTPLLAVMLLPPLSCTCAGLPADAAVTRSTFAPACVCACVVRWRGQGRGVCVVAAHAPQHTGQNAVLAVRQLSCSCQQGPAHPPVKIESFGSREASCCAMAPMPRAGRQLEPVASMRITNSKSLQACRWPPTGGGWCRGVVTVVPQPLLGCWGAGAVRQPNQTNTVSSAVSPCRLRTCCWL
jgi:hypothetical protein